MKRVDSEKTRILGSLIVLGILLSSAMGADYGGGSGTAEDPYQLWTAAQFDSIRCNMSDWDKHYILMANLDTNGYHGCGYLNVIGYDAGVWGAVAFTGVFDGNGHTISGFSYSDKGGPIGMFGYVAGSNAQIKNLGLIKPQVSSPEQDIVAILVGSLEDGTVSNCFIVDGEVTGLSNVGLLVGKNEAGEIIDCYVTGKVASVNNRAAGLVGINNGMIKSSYAAVKVTGAAELGGLVAMEEVDGEILDAYWDTEVSSLTNMCGAQADGATSCNDAFGKTTAQMKQKSTFVGWDFSKVWKITESRAYPLLKWEKYGGGNGTADDPYQLWTAAQFDTIRCYMADWDKHYILMTDIDTTGYSGCGYLNVIGYDAGVWGAKAFTAIFDGNGHTIAGFTYTDMGGPIGMFGYVAGSNAQIKNLGLIKPWVSSPQQDIVAILVGSLEDGVVSNCFIVDGEVTGLSQVGQLVGKNEAGEIVNCYVTGKAASVNNRAAGLVGINNGTIKSSYAAVKVTGAAELGGLVAIEEVDGEILDAYWDTEVSGLANMCGAQADEATGCNDAFGKTTAQMMQMATFANWDFIHLWDIGQGQIYPFLRRSLASDLNKDGAVNLLDFVIVSEQWMKSE